MTDSEFDNLLTRWAVGSLTDEEFAALEAQLQADPQSRRRLRQHAILDDLLREMPPEEKPAVVLTSLTDESAPVRGSLFLFGLPAAAPFLGVFALGVAVTLAVLWLMPSAKRQGQPVGPISWQMSSLRVDSGSARLELPDVGHVIVDGPAEFDMIDPMRARLTRGRIKVCVTEPTGYGFVVETPYGNVTDLGTEFGLDVPPNGESTGLVVFDGAVDLEVNQVEGDPADPGRVSRLVRGEGVVFDRRGQLHRISSIVTGRLATFSPLTESDDGAQSSLIASVRDNLRTDETKKFYEIVAGSFGEDALSYVDRPHQWNGVTDEGIPSELIGADYVKTFADDDNRTDTKIYVTLRRPARLYVFFDDMIKPPDWLKKEFQKTKHRIGMDLGKWSGATREVRLAEGPGRSIDHRFDIWVRTVTEPGVVVLGSNNRLNRRGKPSMAPYMYGIAAVPLHADSNSETDASSKGRKR